MKRLIKKILDLVRTEWKNRNQRTWCFCPVCNQDLCSTDSFVSDREFVSYKCSRCGCESRWDFDIAPAPILLSHQKLSKRFYIYIY